MHQLDRAATQRQPSLAFAVVATAFTVVSWASAFPLIKVALVDLAPLPLAAVRFSVAGALALAWLAVRRPPLPNKDDLLRLGACGLVGIALYNGLLNAGQRTVGAGAASFIVNTAPVFTAIIARATIGEMYPRRAWLGTCLSLAGVATIASVQPGGLSFGAGATLVLAAAGCQAALFVLQRPLVVRHGAMVCTAHILVIGALFLSPWLPDGVETLIAPGTSPGTIWAVLVLGTVPAALGYAAWAYALARFGPTRAANFLYLVPPTAVAGAFLLTGEVPSWTTLVGGGAAVAGVVVFNALRQRR